MLPAGKVATSEPISGHSLSSSEGLLSSNEGLRLGGNGPGIRPVWNCTLGLEKTELKKFLAGPDHATRRRLSPGHPNNYFKVDRADFAL
jgi:hypothetical protein